MEYNLGKDRIAINGDDENFPYPLKLWYDDEYIYVKVIRIPKYYEFKQNKFAMRLKSKILNIEQDYRDEQWINYFCGPNGFLNHLWIFIETKQISNKHTLCSRKKQIGLGYATKHFYSKMGDFLNQTASGQFKSIQEGDVYKILIQQALTNHQAYLLNRKSVFTTVRATFRYGGPDENLAGRTGINSNLATIIY